MAEDITLKVITEAKSLQGKINEGTLPKDTKRFCLPNYLNP